MLRGALLFHQDCNLIRRGIVETIHHVLHAKIMRPDRIATRAVFQKNALSYARHEFRFIVRAIPDLIYNPKKFHVRSLATFTFLVGW